MRLIFYKEKTGDSVVNYVDSDYTEDSNRKISMWQIYGSNKSTKRDQLAIGFGE